MKRTVLVFSIMLLACAGVRAQAPDTTIHSAAGSPNFLGSWDMVMLSLPQGDVKCQLVLNQSDGKLAGTLKFADPEPAEVPIVNPQIKDSLLTFNATLQSYDVDFKLSQNKDAQINGTMYNDMFSVTGKRAEAVDSVKTK